MSFKPDSSNPLHQRKTNTMTEQGSAPLVTTQIPQQPQPASSINAFGTTPARITLPGANPAQVMASKPILPVEVGPSSSGSRKSLINSQYQHRGQPAHNFVPGPQRTLYKKDSQIYFGPTSYTFVHGRQELFDAQIRSNLRPLRKLLLGDEAPTTRMTQQMTQQLPESNRLIPDPDLMNLSYPDDEEEQEVVGAILASPAMSFDTDKGSESTISSLSTPVPSTGHVSADVVRTVIPIASPHQVLRHETVDLGSPPTYPPTSPYPPVLCTHTPSPSPPPPSYFPIQAKDSEEPNDLPPSTTPRLPESPLFRHHHPSAEHPVKVPSLSPLPSQNIINPQHTIGKRKGCRDVEKESPKAKKPKVSKSILSGRDNTKLQKPNQPHRPDLYDDLPQWKRLFEDPVVDKENQAGCDEPVVSASKDHTKADVGVSPSKCGEVPMPVDVDPPTFDEPEVVDEGFWEGPLKSTHVDVGETVVERSERHISPVPVDTDASTSGNPAPSLVAETPQQRPLDPPSSPTFPTSTIELPDLDFFFDEQGPDIAILHESNGFSTEMSHLSLGQNPPVTDHDEAPSSPVASSSSLAPSSPVVPRPSPRKVQPVPMATLLSWKTNLATIHDKGKNGKLMEIDRRSAKDILRTIMKRRSKILASSLADSELEPVVRLYTGKDAVQGEDMLKNAKLLVSYFEKVLKQNSS